MLALVGTSGVCLWASDSRGCRAGGVAGGDRLWERCLGSVGGGSQRRPLYLSSPRSTKSSATTSDTWRYMIQYMRLKHTKHTGNTMREYLSMSDGVIPSSLLMSCKVINFMVRCHLPGYLSRSSLMDRKFSFTVHENLMLFR